MDSAGPSSPKNPSHPKIPFPSLPDINLPPPPEPTFGTNNQNPPLEPELEPEQPNQQPAFANNNNNEIINLNVDDGDGDGDGDDDGDRHSSISDSGDRYGMQSSLGRMTEMEDTMIAWPRFFGDMDFYAVYDGHFGDSVSNLCKERMHIILEELVTAPDWDEDWGDALIACFARMDQEVVFYPDLHFSGSTALVVIVGPNRIYVANCGNSRAVISHGGFAIQLSIDQTKDGRPDEMDRIGALGGMILPTYIDDLNITRSIGDPYLKPIFISEPEVTSINRTIGDEFLILATDGLWDNVTNEEACDAARSCFTPRSSNLPCAGYSTEAAELLVNLAYTKECEDNVSVIVVNLRNAATDDES